MHNECSARRAKACAVFLVATLSLGGCSGGGTPASVAELGTDDKALLVRMLVEEDHRPAPADAAALNAGLASGTPLLRRFAVRGFGRLEDPTALTEIAPLLDDPDAAVRAQAANAVAQSVYNEPSTVAADLLRERLSTETDAAVQGALAQALGRLRFSAPADLDQTQTTLIELTRGAPLETLVPTLRGLESLARGNRDEVELSSDTVARLIELTRYGRRGAEGFVEPAEDGAVSPETTLAAARVRRLAVATLAAAAALDGATVEAALYDPDVEVRRLAAGTTGTIADAATLPILVQIALADDAGPVRYEGLRGYARRLRSQEGCVPILTAVEDTDAHVALLAIDLLGQGCRGVGAAATENAPVATLLAEIARSTPGLPDPGSVRSADRDGVNEPIAAAISSAAPPVAWHRGAHALVSLARLRPADAATLLPAFALHPTWQVRMYAARAAGTVGAVDTLEQLVQDPRPNVATAALSGLRANLGEAASGSAIMALAGDDYELLMTAAGALEGSTDGRAVATLTATLARLTAQQRETSRDPRVALLRRIGELGAVANADDLRPYLTDFDPRVADLAAEILTAWTDEDVAAAPVPLAAQPFPPDTDLLQLEGATARIYMQGGGIIDVMLHPFEAPTNVARFARQARDGYFEGLTFHRVVPNFVVQGGSPDANEFVGDGPYSRDEVDTRSQLRGTVGISTRGRDTGDSQLFINLVDNVRLDHNYTIIGTIASGMDTVDAALEGATIERITIETNARPN